MLKGTQYNTLQTVSVWYKRQKLLDAYHSFLKNKHKFNLMLNLCSIGEPFMPPTTVTNVTQNPF